MRGQARPDFPASTANGGLFLYGCKLAPLRPHHHLGQICEVFLIYGRWQKNENLNDEPFHARRLVLWAGCRRSPQVQNLECPITRNKDLHLIHEVQMCIPSCIFCATHHMMDRSWIERVYSTVDRHTCKGLPHQSRELFRIHVLDSFVTQQLPGQKP